MTPSVLLLNGSLRGPDGNTGWLVAEAARRLQGRARCDVVQLADPMVDMEALAQQLRGACGLVVATGVYWHGWGSPMQRFLEAFTPYENTDLFFGKPVSALVTMDSVGGAELCARLLGVFNQFGCMVPPCSSLVLSRVGLEAANAAHGRADGDHDPNDDVWQIEDLDVVLDNLLAPTEGRPHRPWPFRPLIAPRGAYPSHGRLDLGSPRFLPPGRTPTIG